jgi:hypothetical protein
MNPENQRPRARKQHLGDGAGQHLHRLPQGHRPQERARPAVGQGAGRSGKARRIAYVRAITPEYREGLARAEAREKDAEAKQKAIVADAVKAALADARARTAAPVATATAAVAGAPASSGAAAAAGPDQLGLGRREDARLLLSRPGLL